MDNLTGFNMLNLTGFNWYGFLIGGGMIVCIFLAWFLIKKRGYNSDIVFDVALICIPMAIVGARLYYIVFSIWGGETTFSHWFNSDFTFLGFTRVDGKLTFDGLAGLAIYGGLIFAVLGAVIVRVINKRGIEKGKKKPTDRMTFIQMLDAFFILIILGQAIGRWGNFTNGEAYGRLITNPSFQHFPFGVQVKVNGITEWHQATFFYESLCNIIGFGLLLWLYYGKRKSFDGFNFAVYCIWYGTVRVIVEGLREDSLYIGSSIRVSQLLSGLLIAFGIGLIVYHIIMAKRANKKIFIFTDQQLLNTDYYGYDKTIMFIKLQYAEKEQSDKDESAKGSGFSYAENQTDVNGKQDNVNEKED